MRRLGAAILGCLLVAAPALGAEGDGAILESAVGASGAGWRGVAALVVFVLAYLTVITEELHGLQKSKPVILGAGAIWLIIATGASDLGFDEDQLHDAVMHELMGFAGMFLFLLVSMTYVNAMNDRNVFAALRSWIVSLGLSYKRLFWATGVLAFVLSGMVDNLISALLMGAIITSVGRDSPRFVTLACVNTVVAANSGGAFSPFGDITTLMVWQSGTLSFFQFFPLFLPSLVSWLVPAIVMTMFVQDGAPALDDEGAYSPRLKPGARRVCVLFVMTIALAVSFEHFFALPPFLGMMTGMSLLMLFTYVVKLGASGPEGRHADREPSNQKQADGNGNGAPGTQHYGRRASDGDGLDVYREVGRAEWDTLLFFFGIIFCVGGLSFLGYLEFVGSELYGSFGPGPTNVIAGALSSVVDNIPVMFAILSMSPEMSTFHWLLITYCVGVGGSLLSIGSAAGVGLMGIAKGRYTFLSHLKWSGVIALGYAAGIAVHYALH